MTALAIRKLTLYKHGLGYFFRRGAYTGSAIHLAFPRRAMNDVLKSLVAIDHQNPGAILGLSFETPPDRNAAMHKAMLAIDPHASLLDLLTVLRGRQVTLTLHDGSVQSGAVLGVQNDNTGESISRQLLLRTEQTIKVINLTALNSIGLDDETVRADLEHLLRAARSDEEREQTCLQLTDGPHDLQISYIAPAPAWRVSYRLVLDDAKMESDLLLQGWGLFDNTLDEDLHEVELRLVAGMPVSFQYLLHAPNTPTRSILEDENRTVDAPIEFAAPQLKMAKAAPASARTRGIASPNMLMETAMVGASMSDAMMSASAPVASAEDRGALFAYHIAKPVSVGRGQSAMVPLLSCKPQGKRELLYNPAKQAKHPVASVRFRNESGFTLERGPLTVFDQAEYAGEAVLAVTADQAEVIVAYAVELGISISEQSRYEQRRMALIVQAGGLFQQDWQYRVTEYQLISKRNSDAIVTIEHQRAASYELDPEQAEAVYAETNFARWNVALAAFSKAAFVVRERVLIAQRIELDQLPNDLLEDYIKHGQIAEAALAKLRAAYAVRARLQPVLQSLSQIQQRRNELAQQQQRLRENLAPLKDSGAEAALRARFATELGRVEDEVQELNKKETNLLSERDQLVAAQAQALS